jgi:hypothetical protein
MTVKAFWTLSALFYGLMVFGQNQDSLLQHKKDSIAWTKKSFEGEIIYEIQVLNPNQNIISDEEFYYELPNRGKSFVVMLVKNGSYKMTTGDWVTLYDGAQGKIFTYKKINPTDSIRHDTANYTDPKEPKDKLLSILPLSQTKSVMDHICRSIETKNMWGSKRYYFNDQLLKINPELFKNHFFDDLYPYLNLSKALPLEVETNSTLGKSRMTAIQITEKKIDDIEFRMPKFKTIIKTNH